MVLLLRMVVHMRSIIEAFLVGIIILLVIALLPTVNKAIFPESVVYIVPSNIQRCLPDNELTKVVLTLNDGKLNCEKHEDLTSKQSNSLYRSAMNLPNNYKVGL